MYWVIEEASEKPRTSMHHVFGHSFLSCLQCLTVTSTQLSYHIETILMNSVAFDALSSCHLFLVLNDLAELEGMFRSQCLLMASATRCLARLAYPSIHTWKGSKWCSADVLLVIYIWRCFVLILLALCLLKDLGCRNSLLCICQPLLLFSSRLCCYSCVLLRHSLHENHTLRRSK